MVGERLEEVIELHSKLAVRYKEYELTDGQTPPIVVLNEMRYALRASIKLLSQASFEHLNDAELEVHEVSIQEFSHALRNAYHDLVDGILIQISRMMDNAIADYPVAAAKVLGEKRLAILKDLNDVERHIAKSRGEGNKRQELYDTEIYEAWFAKIVDHYRFVDQVALTDIIREHDRLESESIKKTRRFQLGIGLTILGILISAATLLD